MSKRSSSSSMTYWNRMVQKGNELIVSDSIGSIFSVTVMLMFLIGLLFYLMTTRSSDTHLIHGNEEEYMKSMSHHVLEEGYDIDGFWNSMDSTTIHAQTVYVIPGGGSGISYIADESSAELAYPLWTKQRVDAAYQHYVSNSMESKAIFFALSAGSLNAPNLRSSSNGNIIFECQHIIRHLKKLGIKENLIYGDFISWDTVGNGLTLRLFIEGLLSIQESASKYSNDDTPFRKDPLEIAVFISDFHAERVHAIFDWILDLHPSLLSSSSSLNNQKPAIQLRVHSVSSEGVHWKSKEEYESRIQHERKGVEQIEENKKHIKTFDQLKAFLLLGQHKGIYKYLQGNYVASKGGGW